MDAIVGWPDRWIWVMIVSLAPTTNRNSGKVELQIGSGLVGRPFGRISRDRGVVFVTNGWVNGSGLVGIANGWIN